MSETRSVRAAMSIDDVVDESRVGRSSIYKELAAGRLKARKAGSRTIVVRADFDVWLAGLPIFTTTVLS